MDAKKAATFAAVMFLLAGVALLPIDKEASLVLAILSSVTFLAEKAMRVKIKPVRMPRKYRIYNLSDGSVIKGEIE